MAGTQLTVGLRGLTQTETQFRADAISCQDYKIWISKQEEGKPPIGF